MACGGVGAELVVIQRLNHVVADDTAMATRRDSDNGFLYSVYLQYVVFGLCVIAECM